MTGDVDRRSVDSRPTRTQVPSKNETRREAHEEEGKERENTLELRSKYDDPPRRARKALKYM
jgi:hypothetical protein